MNNIYGCLSACFIAQSVCADEVARQAEAIHFLGELQADYLRQVDISSDTIRAFAERRAQISGVQANCRGVTSEQLPDEAEKAGEALVVEVGGLVDLLASFSSDYLTPPTPGDYRSEFLAGWGQGCSATPPQDGQRIVSTFEAIRAVILIENDIHSRRQDIIRRLREQNDQ